MVYVQPSIYCGKGDTQTPLGFWDTKYHLISDRWPDLVIINKKKRTFWIMDFVFLADHRIKLKESEKKVKYLDLAWELKKLWNMKVTIIPIVTGALDTKGLVMGLEDSKIRGRVETIQTTALLRSARILRRVLEIWENLLSLKLQSKTISISWCKKLSRSKFIIIIIYYY